MTARLRTSFATHRGGLWSVSSVAWARSPDGTPILAVTSHDATTCCIWDPVTGTRRTILAGHTGPVRSVAWTRRTGGTSLLATAAEDRTARIWDPDTGACLHTLTAHTETVRSVAWTERCGSNPLLATSSYDRTARVWDPDTGACLTILTGHTKWVTSVAWIEGTGGRPLLATSSWDKTARIWDPDTGTCLTTLTGHRSAVWSVAWTDGPGGASLLATASYDHTARIWDPDTGTCLTTLTGHTGEVSSVAWIDGHGCTPLLATASADHSARIWNPDTGTALARLEHPDEVNTVALTTGPGSSVVLATGCNDGNVRIFDLEVIRTPAHPGTGGEELSTQIPAPRRRSAAPIAGLRRAATGVAALGCRGPHPPLGLVCDLVALTGPAPGTTPGTSTGTSTGPGAGPGAGAGARAAPGAGVTGSGRRDMPGPARVALFDERLQPLSELPGVRRLRGLGWPPAARIGLAALLTADAPAHARFSPPPDARPGELRDALLAALASPGIPPTGTSVSVDALRAAAERVDVRTAALLTAVGPDAVAADPALPLKLRDRAPAMPQLTSRQCAILADVATTLTSVEQYSHADAGSLAHAPGSAGVSRHGQITNLLPTELVLPATLFQLRHARGELLYRLHAGHAEERPEPVTLLLDTSPPTFGPVECVLKLAAHLATMTLWRAGLCPMLIRMDRPRLALPLAGQRDLATLWTSRSLDPPDVAEALATARRIPVPAAILTQRHLAGEHPVHPNRMVRLVTTHVPGDEPPQLPGNTAYHRHLSVDATSAELLDAVRMLLRPTTAAEPDVPAPRARSTPPTRSVSPARPAPPAPAPAPFGRTRRQ